MTAPTEAPTQDKFVLFAGRDMLEPEKAKAPTFSHYEKDGKKVLVVKDVPVFRSGTFRDSIGFQHTYDDFAIEGFVRNFDYLHNQKILTDVPVRKGHPSFGTNRMDGLIGYVTAMRHEKRTAPHDSTEYTYLLADFEILDPEAAANIESGLWRNRSAETGTYVDNREQEYAPAFMGVAYVDIPAVEGLNGFSKDASSANVHFMMEETMTAPVPPIGGAAAPHAFQIGGNSVTDPKAVQDYINATVKERDDFAAEIPALRQFKKDTIDANREAFVSKLIDDEVVLASQKDGLVALAKGLNSEQFEQWRGSFAGMGKQTLLENHGHQSSTTPDGGAADKAKAQELQDNIEIVRGLGFSKAMSEEKIKQTPAYQKVIAADPTFQL